MDRRLPSMKALRVFEAAARHLSFTEAATKAAEELNVTQAVISHRVKTLEERLSVRLFHLYNRTLELTDAGCLVQPFGPALPSDYAYWLVSTPDVAEHRNARIFRDWLLAEAASAQ